MWEDIEEPIVFQGHAKRLGNKDEAQNFPSKEFLS